MSDAQAIVATIKQYVEGGRLGKSEVMKKAFVDDATMYYVIDGQLQGGPIQALYDVADAAGPAPDLRSEIGEVDINETTATVRVELFDWAGARYTDQLTLAKIDGDWKIIHKVYHTH